MNREYYEFEKTIGYSFNDTELLIKAFTHSSYAAGSGDIESNERLEFLGDAFLDAIVGEELYKLLPDTVEGTLSKLRAAVVCEASLAACGRKIGVNEFLFLGRGEELSGGRERVSIIADATEALIGAVFLDGGYAAAKKLVLELTADQIKNAIAGDSIRDYKSDIQAEVQAKHSGELEYVVVGEDGPPHRRTFTSELRLNGKTIGRGTGKTKKEAEKNAAKEALESGVTSVL